MDLSVNVCLAGLSTTALGLHLYLKPPHSTSSSTSSSSPTSSLTWIYLPAHLLALFSDWLQGPYVFQVSHLHWGFHLPVLLQLCHGVSIVFQLYRHHGHSDGSIALLFLAGYVSSCFLGRYNNSFLVHLKIHRQRDVDQVCTDQHHDHSVGSLPRRVGRVATQVIGPITFLL